MKNSKLLIVLLFAFITSINGFSQSKITGTIKGLLDKDSVIVRVQKSVSFFFYKKVFGQPNNTDVLFSFDNLQNGKWALNIDAKGYLFPSSEVVEVNNSTANIILSLTKSTSDSNFVFTWQDDSSFVGHSQQAYINDKVEIKVLGIAEKVPDDFNAINILNEYGFLLSDNESKWTSEDAYRFYQTMKKLNFQKFSEKDVIYVKAKCVLSESKIDRDISFTTNQGIDYIRISRDAFTYASPQVVTVDGLKGKFFSKRLYSAIVYYYTDKGSKKNLVSQIAKDRYGFEFAEPNSFLRSLMNETESNFQEFTSDEKLIILSMFEEFPDAMQRQDQLKFMVRRINGQKHPLYPDAPAIAWVQNKNIEWMESSFKEQTIEYMQRLVLHEKSHFFWEYTFDAKTKKDWSNLGGWFLDPTSISGWSTTNTTEFVSAYAHLKDPNEDMAESMAFYITNPEALRSRSQKKFEFIRDRIMKGTLYISVIRPDLTFQVFNLYPDYNYPGKIKRTKLEVIGKADEDKKIVLEIELNIVNPKSDGGDLAYCRFTSSIGTIRDMYLLPVNAEKSILRGEISLSKLAKSGFWIIPQITVTDLVGNMRLENNSTYGLKCFIDNPLEDITPPLYIQNSIKLESVTGKFYNFLGFRAEDWCGQCADTLIPMQAMRMRLKIEEKNTINPFGRVMARIFFPSLDSTNRTNIIPYSKDVQINGKGIINDFKDSIKNIDFYFPVPDYYPSGYYSISYLSLEDLANNVRQVFFDKDISNQNFFMPPNFVNQRSLRDSIYFKTKYPDYKPPVLDLNDIKIQATPTNPSAPNGETLFEMWLWIKDESDFPGHGSGFANGSYTLRDPQGLEHYFPMQSNLGELLYQISPDSSIFGYKRYYFKTLIPIGSPPGIWGVTSIILEDHAANRKYYSFVEIVRFDVEQSTVLQVTPYVEILGKKVNSKNVDSVDVKIGCKDCKDQFYRLKIYSSMGGNSFINEGKMDADTIILKGLNLSGVNDGILYTTAFMLDNTKALIGIGKANFTKYTQKPNAAGTISGTAYVCIGSSNVAFNVPLITGATSYIWTLPSGATGLSTTNNISVNFSNSAVSSNIKVKGQNENGDGAPSTLAVTVNPLPAIAGTITGTTTVCQGQNTITYSVPAIANAMTYLWTLPTGTTGTSTTNSITLNYGSSAVSGNITVKGNNSCGEGPESTLAITVNQLPANAGTITGTATVCQGQSAVNYTVPIIANATSYVWTLPTGATGTSTTNSISVNYGTLAVTGNITVKGNNSCGDGSTAILVITVNPKPATPVVTVNANILLSNASTGNQWYNQNVIINGATNQDYTFTAIGNYSVIVSLNGCASDPSATNMITGIDPNESNPSIKVYPNPITDELNIEFVGNTLRTEFVIVNSKGQVVFSGNLFEKVVIQTSNFSPGLYFIKLKSGKTIEFKKIVKL